VALEYVSGKMENELPFAEYVAANTVESSSKRLTERSYFTGSIDGLSDRPGKGRKPLLVMFEQGTCKNCDTLHDSILSKPESQELLAQFDIYQVDMWGREPFETPQGVETSGRQWSQELNISYAPTMILYAADGKEVIRSEAFFKTFHTQSILEYVVSGQWETEPSFQRYLSARADALREQGKNVNIWDETQ